MPKQYEAIRDKFKAEGMGLAEAKTRAAKIYNSTHRNNPVTGKSEGKMSYAKGGNIQTAHYAAGGPVLGRTREFIKTPNEFSEISHGSGKTDENFGKTGKGERGKDKSLAPVKPRK